MNAHQSSSAFLSPASVLAALLVMCSGSTLRAGITISPPYASGPISHHCPVPAGQYDLCTTTLTPPSRATQDPTFPTRLAQTGWTFTNAPQADFPNVTINIRMYHPHLCNPIDEPVTIVPGNVNLTRLPGSHCSHGAEPEMALLLAPDPGHSESWRWLQIGHDYGTFCLDPAGGQWYLDNAGDDPSMPFYGSQASIHTFTSAPWNRPATWFFDTPEDGCWFNSLGRGSDCPRPDHWSVQSDTYLTKFNSATQTVTIYEGIHWGFQADCVPEPGTVALMFAGLGLLTWRIRVHH